MKRGFVLFESCLSDIPPVHSSLIHALFDIVFGQSIGDSIIPIEIGIHVEISPGHFHSFFCTFIRTIILWDVAVTGHPMQDE